MPAVGLGCHIHGLTSAGPNSIGHRFRLRFIQISQRDLRALRREALGDGLADAGGRAGYQGDFAGHALILPGFHTRAGMAGDEGAGFIPAVRYAANSSMTCDEVCLWFVGLKKNVLPKLADSYMAARLFPDRPVEAVVHFKSVRVNDLPLAIHRLEGATVVHSCRSADASIR